MGRSYSIIEEAVAESGADHGTFDRAGYVLVPCFVAPHANKLRGAEVAAGDGKPLAGLRRVLRSECTKILDPIPLQ